jgi:hypothetical protein
MQGTGASETLVAYGDGNELYGHVRTTVEEAASTEENPAYITSDVLQRCRGANLMGSTEISHLGIGICLSRIEDKTIGISIVQLPSRSPSTIRAIYSARLDVGICIDHAILPSRLVAHLMRQCQRTESLRLSSILSILHFPWRFRAASHQDPHAGSSQLVPSLRYDAL